MGERPIRWDTVLITSTSQEYMSSANKIMAKMRYQKDKGLGKNLQGHILPMAPLVKLDKSGIRYDSNL